MNANNANIIARLRGLPRFRRSFSEEKKPDTKQARHPRAGGSPDMYRKRPDTRFIGRRSFKPKSPGK
jgi:hypothetical protein